MSTNQLRRSGQNVVNSRPGSNPASSRGNTRKRGAKYGGLATAKSSGIDRVWGKPPPAATDSNSMTLLFEESVRLKAATLRQSRLAKLDVSELRSTEAERLRMVHQRIVDASSSVEGAINPFRDRVLTVPQILSEEMIRRQGKRTIDTKSTYAATAPRPKSNTLRPRKRKTDPDANQVWKGPGLEDLFSLRGPLVREFRRAVHRGYKGPPSRWLRGSRAALLIAKLRSRGLVSAPPRDIHMFSVRSPLHFAVNGCSGIGEHPFAYGFQGERIYHELGQRSTFVRQVAAVPRLPLSHWPRAGALHATHVGRAWPTCPTLNESWEMMMRGKVPQHHTTSPRPLNERQERMPTRQVKPGSSARAVSNYVIGIRADLEVPRKFLGYFRYRWGFLILRRHGFLKRDFVLWITKLWKSNLSGMFLKRFIRYNDALRRIPPSMYYMMCGFVSARSKESRPEPGRPSSGRTRRSKNRRMLQSSVALDSAQTSSDTSGDGVRLC